ncbi:S1C family serine protease [Paractinoplanes atraurantiacus]|uniref:Putative serine protease PepD n=1 Tax=Paractinoplanes atraurantiacus TaxID=1036182 RepID=A0A285GX73_9ACTN|nr:trypsin-like peptidase domain-containing protein [Actinoplanes atraurantiacus]SNY28068.1 putative serine protease PepD [Actinoplanes atraurantiacus]
MRLTPGRLVAGAVALALLSGITGGLLGAAVSGSGGDGRPAAAAATGGTACDVTQVAATVFPSLVTINVRRGATGGLGSGSVLDRDGNILTNDHVIAPAFGAGTTPATITVDFARGASEVPATVVGRDPATDLAVLRVDPAAATLTPIAIGDSSALVVGQPVVAAGSPLGLNSTITAGVVSALNRWIDVGDGAEPAALVNAVQTDAAVNQGNSGGPLTDCAGRQVGVNSAGAQPPEGGGGSIGLNFAIPIDFALSVAEQLIGDKKATHPVIGVMSVSVTDEIARSTGLPRGALVEQVVPGFGAARAGMRPGDVITQVGGTAVNGTDQMLVAIRTHKPGDTVDVRFSRGGSAQTAQVPVTEP